MEVANYYYNKIYAYFFSQSKVQETIQMMRNTLDFIEKKEKEYESVINELYDNTKKLPNSAKIKKIFNLRKMRVYEELIKQLHHKKLNIETQIMTIEFASLNKDLVLAMKAGNNSLRYIFNNSNVDDIENTITDTQDNIEMSNEISTLLNEKLYNDISYESCDIDKELERYQALATDTSNELIEQFESIPKIKGSEEEEEDILDVNNFVLQ